MILDTMQPSFLSFSKLASSLRMLRGFFNGKRSRRVPTVASSPRIEQPSFLRREEPLSGYCIGGYHPTNIGDKLGDRYQILRKLGWGNYSTVWLAQDKKTDEYRSVKILTGIATNSTKLHELEFLQHTAKYDLAHPGYSRVMRLLDHFHHSGPYGRHLCLVTELLGESVQSLTGYSKVNTIHLIDAKGIVRDILQGLDYLHKSGIVHTDLKFDNFLLEFDNMNAYVRRLRETSTPEVYPEVQAVDGRTIRYVKSAPFIIPHEIIQARKPLRAKIVDLGVERHYFSTCWDSKTAVYPGGVAQPPGVRAPEIYVGADWDSKVDIWSLGLLIVEMFRGKAPLLPAPSALEINVMFLFRLFGKFPLDLLKRGKYSSKYFYRDVDGAGSFLYDELLERGEGIPRWTELLTEYTELLHPDEYNSLMSFLEEALRVRPEDRWPAAQLLEHEWLKSEDSLSRTLG